MFRVNNKDTRTTCDVVLESLLLILNIFEVFFKCFCCWLWTWNFFCWVYSHGAPILSTRWQYESIYKGMWRIGMNIMTEYSKMDQVKFVEDSLWKIWSDMVYLSRRYRFKFFKGCLPQIWLSPFLNTFTQLFLDITKTVFFSYGLWVTYSWNVEKSNCILDHQDLSSATVHQVMSTRRPFVIWLM